MYLLQSWHVQFTAKRPSAKGGTSADPVRQYEECLHFPLLKDKL